MALPKRWKLRNNSYLRTDNSMDSTTITIEVEACYSLSADPIQRLLGCLPVLPPNPVGCENRNGGGKP